MHQIAFSFVMLNQFCTIKNITKLKKEGEYAPNWILIFSFEVSMKYFQRLSFEI